MNGKQLLKLALGNGFTLDRVNGSHHIVVKGDVTVVIPVHGSKDIPKGTAEKIQKVLGLK